MKWFKHDADASSDAKISKLLIRHGAVGYAVYFHCLELISGNVTNDNITFELEHDSEIIADNLRIRGTNDKSGIEVVEEIMRYIVDLKLFENHNGRITCFKMIKRLDSSMTSNPKFRKLIAEAKEHHDLLVNSHDSNDESHDSVKETADGVMILGQKVMQEENRIEKNRIEENTIENIYGKLDFKKIIETFNSICISLPKVMKVTDKRRKSISAIIKNYSEEELFAAYEKAEQSDFLTNRDGNGWQCSFDWIMNNNNMIKIVEGNYDNKKKTQKSLKPRHSTEPGTASVDDYNHER